MEMVNLRGSDKTKDTEKRTKSYIQLRIKYSLFLSLCIYLYLSIYLSLRILISILNFRTQVKGDESKMRECVFPV